MNTHDVASIVLVTPQGKLLFQKRDKKPQIRNPGMVTAWGGACEGNETPLQAAVREIEEETNLRPAEQDFRLLKVYPRNDYIDGCQVVNHVYVLDSVTEEGLKVYEGQGILSVDPLDVTTNAHYTDLTVEIISDYKKHIKL